MCTLGRGVFLCANQWFSHVIWRATWLCFLFPKCKTKKRTFMWKKTKNKQKSHKKKKCCHWSYFQGDRVPASPQPFRIENTTTPRPQNGPYCSLKLSISRHQVTDKSWDPRFYMQQDSLIITVATKAILNKSRCLPKMWKEQWFWLVSHHNIPSIPSQRA